MDFSPRLHIRALARLQQIHEEISSGGYPSIPKLAEITGRHPRTIKRDLKALSEDFKAPLRYDRQHRGYRYAKPGWQLPPVRFSEGELLAFFTAQHVMQMLGQTPEANFLQSALGKLAALLPDQVSFNPNTIGSSLTFQPMPHVMVESYALQLLTRAAAEYRTLFIHYYSQHRDEMTERKIDVLHLHNFAGDWYAIAFDHLRQALRDFHVGRIRSLRNTEDFFVPPPDWDANAYLRRGFL